MNYEKNRKIAGMDEFKVQKMAKILIIPAVVVVLVIAILIADRKSSFVQVSTEVSSAGTVAVTMASEQSVPEETAALQSDVSEETISHDFDSGGLRKNAVPEINELVAKYQRARVTGDAALLYETFGRSDEEGLEEMTSKLKDEAEVYESFDDTAVYTADGPEPDTYLAFISSRLKFKGIETAAPMLTWAYVVKSQDRSWYMKQPDTLNETEKQWLDKVSSMEDVALLDAEMRKSLAQAVLSDVQLAALYQIWADTDGNTAAKPSEASDVLTVNDEQAASVTADMSQSSDEGQTEADIQIGID